MIPVPDPLHPAIVHFPIVLILLGTVAAIIAVFVRRWHLPWIAAALLILGAIGGFAATWTGSQAEETIGELPESTEQILEEHEEWGERARNVAAFAAVLAVLAASLGRFPLISRPTAFAVAMLALGASYCVAQAGHYGGLLVYKHGVGINTAAAASTLPAKAGETKGGDDDD